MKLSDSQLISCIQFADQSAPPAAPVPGMKRLFVMSDGVYLIDSNNNVTGPLSIGGAVGPATQVIEQSGPTQLDIVGLGDQEFLMRDGNTIASRPLNGIYQRSDYAMIREEQPSGVNGVDYIAADGWAEVVFNAEVIDVGGCLSMNGNHFVLEPGEYAYQISVSGNGSNHVIKLFNVTDNADQPVGEGMPMGGRAPSTIIGIFRIDVPTEFCVHHWCENDGAVGQALGAGILEIYSTAQFWRRSL